MEKDEAIKLLFNKYLAGNCSEEESGILFDYFNIEQNDLLLRQIISEELDRDDHPQALESLITNLDKRMSNEIRSWQAGNQPAGPNKIMPLWKWAISSAALVVIGLSLYLQQAGKHDSGIVNEARYGYQNDVLPAEHKASLLKSDGSSEDFTSPLTGQTGKERLSAGENRLIVPKGATYKIHLDDSTSVWLNAQSELVYPDKFSSNERKVYLKGEAFFEVAKDSSRPFRVVVNRKTIEVLGTSFNINAYGANVEATLVEGSIRIINQAGAALMSPGQEATISDTYTRIRNVDVQPNVIWKNGEFYFNGEHFDDIMNEISRWYNIELKYEGQVPGKKYTGSISRNARLSDVLEMLKTVSGASFDIQARIVTIKFK